MVAGAASLDLIVEVLSTTPLRLHVSLHQPEAAEDVAWVPRMLRPVGAFVRVAVLDSAGESVFTTNVPKFKPKLKPEHEASYLCLDAGYSYGTVFDVDFDLSRVEDGAFRVEVVYSNLDYRGTSDHPLGELELTTTREIRSGQSR